MEIYNILCLVGIPTLSTLVVTYCFNKIVHGTESAKRKRATEDKANLKELFDEFITPMNETLNEVSDNIKLVASGALASLRNDLLECFYSCKEKGYRNQDDTKAFKEMFDAYISLGGNDIIENDIEPAFHSLSFLTPEEEAAKLHASMTAEDKFKKRWEKAVNRAETCPYNNKKGE